VDSEAASAELCVSVLAGCPSPRLCHLTNKVRHEGLWPRAAVAVAEALAALKAGRLCETMGGREVRCLSAGSAEAPLPLQIVLQRCATASATDCSSASASSGGPFGAPLAACPAVHGEGVGREHARAARGQGGRKWLYTRSPTTWTLRWKLRSRFPEVFERVAEHRDGGEGFGLCV